MNTILIPSLLEKCCIYMRKTETSIPDYASPTFLNSHNDKYAQFKCHQCNTKGVQEE